jgi:predicted nucleic acid-binding protein
MISKILPFSDTSQNLTSDDIVMLDTSFVYELWGKSVDPVRKSECEDFTNQIAVIGGTIVTGIKLHEELRLVVSRDMLGNKKARKKLLDKDPLGMNQVIQRAHEIEEDLRNNPNYYPERLGCMNDKFLDIIDNYMGLYGLELGDAVIYGIAKDESITVIATVDGDYARINDPNLIVLTDTKHMNEIVPQYKALNSSNITLTL